MGAEKLKVVLFSGGTGTGSISDALLRHPDIELTMLVNAYDDGKSTGLLRRFIPGMLGPSDIRKVVSSLLKPKPDSPSQSLRSILEYRLPKDITSEGAIQLLKGFIDWPTPRFSHEMLQAKEKLTLHQMRTLADYLESFLTYFEKEVKQKTWFTFADNSLGNLLFGGCYLQSNRDFNLTMANFCDFAEVGQGVINITHGENLVLTALKENGQYLADEASIVGPQDAVPIEEIFLLPDYLDAQIIDRLSDKKEKIAFLRKHETLPKLNPEAEAVLREADIIIYGPGTQHSSLYPSYLTHGVAEAIQANKLAEKIFIANIARDHDILAADASGLVNGLIFNMSRKGTCEVRNRDLVTRFFFQKPEETATTTSDYLPFEMKHFKYSMDKVVWIDLEGDKGKHSGGRTVSELLIIVEEQLRRRIHHIPHKISIIVPALNEENTIESVLTSLSELQFSTLEKEIIVVDGGSTDNTWNIIRAQPKIRSYQLSAVKGRGMALRLGIEKAKGEIIVSFPSDGEYTATDIARIVGPLIRHEFSVVFGSRAFRSDLSGTLERVYGNRGALFTMSKYGGMLLSIMTLVLYQRYIGDPLTSIKGFNARVFRGMEFRRTGVDFDLELIAKVARSKYSILEVPVNYKARTSKQGKKIKITDGIKSIITLLRFSRYEAPKNRTKELGKPMSQAREARNA